MFNKVILAGNLTRDIELRNTPTGLAVANTGIACNRKFKSQAGESKDEVLFLDLTFFGRIAEIAQQYLKKGSKILVDGRLKFDQWTDTNGQKRSKHSLVVESMKMIGGREEYHHTTPLPPLEQKRDTAPIPAVSNEVELSFDETNIPF